MNTSTQKQEMHIHADVAHNVHVIVGKPMSDGRIQISTDRTFKNTATRLMTQSIAEFLAGSEHSYNRKGGRPNFISFGTMGIIKQPNLTDITPDETEPNPDDPEGPPIIVKEGNWREYLEEHFTDIVFDNPEDRTRPWYESTSLALTDTCGTPDTDTEGYNKHFWHTAWGWGSETSHGTGDPPVYQGELCTEYGNPFNDKQIVRPPILRADVETDCPQDLEYGKDGYCSTVIFYGYASVKWVNDLLEPSKGIETVDPDTGTSTQKSMPVGPQLSRMAISEFGLYEKSNEDPHGMYTLFAGFRVPTIEDIVYVSKDEVILVEWRVTIRALMPNEAVYATDNEHRRVSGVAVNAFVQDKTDEDPNYYVQMSGTVLGEAGVSQAILWSIPEEYEPASAIDEITGLLTITPEENHEVIYVTGKASANTEAYSTAAIITGLIKNYVYGISITSEIEDQLHINFTARVLSKGTVDTGVTWYWESADPEHPDLDPDTKITVNPYKVAKLEISPTEQARQILITAKTIADPENVFSAAAVVRIGQSEGYYMISDFTILT